MEGQSVSLVIAFVAGILSFLSPCHLAVVPGYIGFLSGAAASGGRIDADARPLLWRRTLSNAFGFVFGFSAVFVILGASVGLVGYLIYDYLPLLRRVGGIVLILFGLHFLGLLRIPFLYREARLSSSGINRSGGLVSALTLGAVFGIGWTPCVGPTLTAILFLASTTQTVGHGALLLALYSAGLGIPFIFTALLLRPATVVLQKINRRGNLISIASGALLIGLGMLLFTDRLAQMSAIFGFWSPFNL